MAAFAGVNSDGNPKPICGERKVQLIMFTYLPDQLDNFFGECRGKRIAPTLKFDGEFRSRIVMANFNRRCQFRVN